jgi:hypothetical protein
MSSLLRKYCIIDGLFQAMMSTQKSLWAQLPSQV